MAVRDDPTPRPANDGLAWTREQLILAFELYCRIPFGRITTPHAQPASPGARGDPGANPAPTSLRRPQAGQSRGL